MKTLVHMRVVGSMVFVEPAEPIPMILHCPVCFHQHIDGPEQPRGCAECPHGTSRIYEYDCAFPDCSPHWTNPPHKSHKCANCGATWRPADVPTVGVLSIKTHGKNDSVVYDT